MSDDPRALLTDGEKAVLSGEKDTTDSYRYKIRSQVRSKVQKLGDDLDFLHEHAPGLAEELEDEVCDSEAESVGVVLERIDELEEKLDQLLDEG